MISFNNRQDCILQAFEKQKIRLAGIYAAHSLSGNNREAEKLQNYNQIYIDFECKNPKTSCMLIACHKYVDEPEKIEDLIYLNRGIKPKLNLERSPVSSFEYPNCPFTVLLPDYRINDRITVLDSILNDLANFVKGFKAYKDTLDFGEFFKKFEYFVIESIVPHHVLLNTIQKKIFKEDLKNDKKEKDFVVFCKLHNRYFLNYPKTYPMNSYVVKAKP